MKTRYRILSLIAVLALLVVAATITVLPHADAARVTVFHVTPKNLTFNTVQGVNPPVQKITLSNSGKHTIYWRTMSAVSMQPVAIVPSGGKIAPGKSMTAMAVVNARRLVPGPYTASFLLNSFDSNNNPTPGHSSVVIEVKVVVTAP